MPSEAAVLPTQPEKPHHYTYLKEFRTQQCPLFVQHKCTQHRPFTCFHWHFANQRRRRPVRKRDGTFNYSADVYCLKYDENAGMCADGDECPYLHRTAGDTERRYHLRYYKTGTCVHDTDSKGHCEKNGAHCAFAHGQADLRVAVYDARDLQAMEQGLAATGGGGSTDALHAPAEAASSGTRVAVGSLEKERSPGDDPCWSDANFVLANYKTEPCKKPPRMCRQGYACPQYHNCRDRRRSPHKHRYRSTPCPSVKHGDEWGDPQGCDSGDSCAYCHTRTEQQFHPEIYKSTKCNDMMQTGYCPRGPFCAFAHVEHEMTQARDSSSAAMSAGPALGDCGQTGAENGGGAGLLDDLDEYFQDRKSASDVLSPINGKLTVGSPGLLLLQEPNNNAIKLQSTSLPDPIGKGRTYSNSSVNSDGRALHEDMHARRHLMLHIDSSAEPGAAAHVEGPLSVGSGGGLLLQRQRHGVLHSISSSLQSHSFGSNASTPSSTMSTSASPFAVPFPQSVGDLGESLLSSALDELNMDDFDLTSIDKELERDDFNDNGCATGPSSAGACMSGYQLSGAVSMPVSIPMAMPGGGSAGGGLQRGFLPSSMPQSPPTGRTVHMGAASPLTTASLPMLFFPSTPRQLHSFQEQMHAALASQAQSFPSRFAGLPLCIDAGSMAAAAAHASATLSTESLHNAASGPAPSARSASAAAPGPASAPVPIPGASAAAPLSSAAATPASLPGCHCCEGGGSSSSSAAEAGRLREELARCRIRLTNWEEGYAQAKTACDAWRKEVDDLRRKLKDCEEQRHAACRQRDEALAQLKVKHDAETKAGSSCLKSLYKFSELETLPLGQLRGLQQQLRRDQDRLEQIVQRQASVVAHGSGSAR